MTLTVRTYGSSGRTIDTAEADSPEAALVAARTLLREGRAALYGCEPRAAFYTDGRLVRDGLRLRDLPLPTKENR